VALVELQRELAIKRLEFRGELASKLYYFQNLLGLEGEMHVRRALIAIEQGDLDTARTQLEAAVKPQPGFAAVAGGMPEIWRSSGQLRFPSRERASEYLLLLSRE
jgi:hypothetical protein